MNPITWQGGIIMKLEDYWMVVLVLFSILWTAAFGWGVFG